MRFSRQLSSPLHIPQSACLQVEAQVEISGGEGDAFAELVSMAVKADPSLADRAARDLAGSRGGAASVVGESSHFVTILQGGQFKSLIHF